MCCLNYSCFVIYCSNCNSIQFHGISFRNERLKDNFLSRDTMSEKFCEKNSVFFVILYLSLSLYYLRKVYLHICRKFFIWKGTELISTGWRILFPNLQKTNVGRPGGKVDLGGGKLNFPPRVKLPSKM